MIKINIEARNYTISEIQNMLNQYPNEIVMLEIINTKSMNANIINMLKRLNGSNRLVIRIVGGYDDERVRNYTASNLVDMHKNDNVYTLDETKRIYDVIADIEKEMNPNWDNLEKLLYFIGYLKNKIIYHPFFENASSRDIRSLRGLYSKKTVCAGYALILKELCDRHGIECQYVEGACNTADQSKGLLTHAWNIVRINGYLVPVDLTWNAGANNIGRMLDTSDLFNVNEFVKSHFPGRYEKIQDYRRDLKSIDGVKVSLISSFITKDVKYENNSFYGKRIDGSKYEINLVGEFIEDNKVIYRYYYQGYSPDGKKGRPLILYSTFNISQVVSFKNRIMKMQQQLVEARKSGNISKVRELEKKLDAQKNKFIFDADRMVDELLLSSENVRESVGRGDYFVGGVRIEKDANDINQAKGVFIDTSLGSKIGLMQKHCTRSDGTSFIIEDFGKFRINSDVEVYRYRVYESVLINNKRVIIKNTIFTDQDLFKDNRQSLYDDFLSRDRLDRKNREANGYLGYYSKEGVRTYSVQVKKFFNELCTRMVVTSRDFRNYYNEITISEMARLVRTYEKVEENGNVYYRNKTTKRPVTEEDLLLHIKFAYLWLFAAGVDYDSKDLQGLYGYTQAFSVSSQKAFEILSQAITSSMNRNGNIDPVSILMDFRKSTKNRQYELLVVRLFSSEEAVRTINQLFRLQNPSAKREAGDIEFFSKGRMTNAEILIKRRQNLEAKKVILEVLKNAQGRVEVKRTK